MHKAHNLYHTVKDARTYRSRVRAYRGDDTSVLRPLSVPDRIMWFLVDLVS